MTEWASFTRTARKQHTCEMCRRIINPGERYRRGVGFDGTAWAWKECRHCSALVSRIDVTDWSDNTYCEDSIREYEPRNFTEARWLCYWRRRWQRRDGGYYPEPQEASA